MYFLSSISFDDVFSGETLDEKVIDKVKNESHTRLYIIAMNILKTLEIRMEENKSDYYMNRFMEFLKAYPVDLMVGIRKDIKVNYPAIYEEALENEKFIESYFESYSMIRG